MSPPLHRILFPLACALIVLAAPARAHALVKPLCSTVTCTGEGGAPTVTVNPGGLSHPEIIPIFWGQYWNAPTDVTVNDKIGQLQYLVNGPYFGGLGEYNANGVGPARMVPIAPINTTPFPSPSWLLEPCTSSTQCTSNGSCDKNSVTGAMQCRLTTAYTVTNMCAMIDAMITASPPQVPPALVEGTGADVLYTVLIPPGPSGSPEDFGFPQVDYNFSCPMTGGTFRALWAWGADSAGLSHEMVESITHNVQVGGCTYNSNGEAATQISDICQCVGERVQQGTRSGCSAPGASCLDGSECCSWSCNSGGTCTDYFEVEPYWSQAAGSCVIPEAWSSVYQYESADDTWTKIGCTVRQIYAGGFGVVATRGDDNVYLYSGPTGSCGAWDAIGVGGAMFSVGESWILGLTPTADNVARFDGTSFTFTPFGPATAVYSGGFDIITDYQGDAWQYLASTQTKVNVGNPSDQFLVGDDWAASLGFQRQNVWLFGGYVSGKQPVWTATGHAASELFVGGDQALAARDLTANPGVHAMTASGATHPNGWKAMGGTGTTTFALSGDTGAPLASVAWSSGSGVVDLETEPIESGTWAWKTDTFGAAGRLVGQGASLYATGPVVNCIPSGDPCGQNVVCCGTTPTCNTSSGTCD